MVLVLILVASASVLGLTYVCRTTVKVAGSNNLLQATRARYLAESGLHHGVYLLQADPNSLSGSDVTPLGPFHVDGTDDSYFFGAAPVTGKPGQYLVSGRGQVGAIRQTVTAKVSVSSEYAAVVNAILQPVSYWRLGETSGATAYDEKSLCNGAYVNGVSLGAEGAVAGNAAARFDGIDDRVDFGKYATPEGFAMTIAAWVLPESYSHLADNDGVIFSKTWARATYGTSCSLWGPGRTAPRHASGSCCRRTRESSISWPLRETSPSASGRSWRRRMTAR